MLDVFAEKMRAVECRDTTPVKLTHFERVRKAFLSPCTALEKVPRVLAGRGDFEPIVIACETRECLEHFVCDRLSFVYDHSHLCAGLIERMSPFGFAGIICHEAFDLAAGVVARNEELYDLKYLPAI